MRLPYNYKSIPIKDIIFSELENPIRQFKNSEELKNLDETKHLIVGYFDREDMPEYDNFRLVALNLKKKCQFYIRYGYFFEKETSKYMRPPNQPTIVFKSGLARLSNKRETFKGCVKNYNELNLWAYKKCTVQEVTFKNFDELKRDGQRFLILFYNSSNPYHITCITDFCNLVGRVLMDQQNCINCVTADATIFSWYLNRLGQTKNNLPIIVYGGYIFPNFKDIYQPGKLKAFVMNYNCVRSHQLKWHRTSFEDSVKLRVPKIGTAYVNTRKSRYR